jgi:glycosyltransferase involved in cell wall biosynthesis
MRITIVGGFFLPIPPLAGGAMEKSWWRLGRLYAARGHTVTQISRRWPGLPNEETRDGVHHLRLQGFDHRHWLWQNLLLDAWWGAKVLPSLPPADILITNTVALPVVVRALRPHAGRLVVNLNRYPKGQLRWYRGVARIQAASPAIADAARREAPALAGRIRVVPNPVEVTAIAAEGRTAAVRPDPTVTAGYFGRLHPEKGLVRLIAAANRLLAAPDLPPWRLILRGPSAVPRGGGGDAFVRELLAASTALRAADRLRIESPLYDAVALHRAYHGLDLFCYPTLAEHGEALPVAVLEAMAAGLPVVVTDLDCFAALVADGVNGLVVPRNNVDPAGALAEALRRLIRDAGLRRQFGDEARRNVSGLDDAVIAGQHLADFEKLIHDSPP